MKISSKIVVLSSALLGFLAGYAYVSGQELSKIHAEFDQVVKNDFKLMESTTALNELQLKKEIIFEKLISSAEELAFGAVNESRRQYLADYVKGLQGHFDD